MGRIGAHLSGIERALLNRLAEADAGATINSLRLASGKKINSPSDNPTAFIALSRFQTRLNVVTATMSNVTAAGSMIGQVQTALGAIRTQLDTIRSELLTDEDQSLTAQERTEAQAKIDAAVSQINALAATQIDGRRLLDGSADFQVSGRNNSQVANLTVYSTGGSGPTQVAKSAELTYSGTDRYATDDAQITFTGTIGSASIAITDNDTLEDVAQAVNDLAGTTGVIASVDDNTLTIASAQTGANETVAVAVVSGTFDVSGGNGDGTADGSDAVYASTPAISGTVLAAATQAQLVHTPAGGTIDDDAQFTLTGSLGSESISVTTGETLAVVAQRINDVSHKTGVTASQDGSDLTFTSVDYGADAEISIVTADTFAVTGGNEDGTANGTDVSAQINGQTYTPVAAPELRHREKGTTFTNDATIEITGHLGTATITITDGDTLSQIAQDINDEAANTGIVATVDGNDLVLSGTTTGADAQISIEVTAGTLDTVTDFTAATQAELVYTGDNGNIAAAADFRLTGNDGFSDFSFDGSETLADVRAAINAENGTTGVIAAVDGDKLYLRSNTDGDTALVQISGVTGSFDVTGGDGNGTANGTNATAAGNGADENSPLATIDGNAITVSKNGFHYRIEFDPTFSGDFNPITVSGGALTFATSTDLHYTSTLAIPSLHAESLGGLSGTLDQIASGGDYSGLSTNTSQAIRIVDEALADLTRVEGSVDGFYNAAVTSSSSLLGALQSDLEDAINETDGYNEDEESLLLAKNQQLANNALSGLAILNQQRYGIVQLIQQTAGLL